MSCAEDHVKCNGTLKRCISVSWLCDADNDCGDYEDERNCPSKFFSNQVALWFYARPLELHVFPRVTFGTSVETSSNCFFV